MSHTFKAPGGTRFHHNPDLSGNIHICNSADENIIVPASDFIEFTSYWTGLMVDRIMEDLPQPTPEAAKVTEDVQRGLDGVLKRFEFQWNTLDTMDRMKSIASEYLTARLGRLTKVNIMPAKRPNPRTGLEEDDPNNLVIEAYHPESQP